jgi:DNA-binding NarL/FixJ family response regulator
MDQLRDHCEELMEALTCTDTFASTADGVWLSERYLEIVPAILPDVLRCLDTGDPLAATSVEAVRESATSILTAEVPLRTVLHGGVPALRVFTAFLQSHQSVMTAAHMATLLGRASLVATELAACWAASWAKEFERTTSPERSGDGAIHEDPLETTAGPAGAITTAPSRSDNVLAVVPVPGQLEQPDLEMVLLAAQGQSNEEIAKQTDYSPQAVKWHLGRVMRDWKVRNRTSLVTAALLKGVIKPRPALISRRPSAPSSKLLERHSTTDD